MRRGLTLFLVLSLLVLTHGVHAQDDPSGQSQEDRWLEETVQRVLEQRGYGRLGVQADNGVVVLTGTVRSARDKVSAIQAVFEITEVQAVESGLTLRNSKTPELEEEVWLTLFQEGLGDGIEEVIVDNGVASVSGRVPDEATRDRIFRAVRSVPGVEAVTSALIAGVVEEAPPEPEPVPEPEPALAPEIADLMAPVPPKPGPEPEPAPPEPEAPEAPVVAEAEPEPEPPPEPEPEAPEPPDVAEPEPAPPPEPEPPAPPPTPPRRDEAEIVRAIAEQIMASNYTVFDHIQFFIESGEVSLGGFVTSKDKIDNLEAAVANIPGVASVQTDVRVLPESKGDDRLRENLFRRIYEDPAFVEFAELQNPPVHIIVDANHVTLAGSVESRIQAMTAEAIVRSTFGVRSVRNRLRVRE